MIFERIRPCEVDGEFCLFHRFIEEEQGVLQVNDNILLPSSAMDRIIRDYEERKIVATCFTLEKLRHAYALVELPDGTVKKVEPEKVRFLDREG